MKSKASVSVPHIPCRDLFHSSSSSIFFLQSEYLFYKRSHIRFICLQVVSKALGQLPGLFTGFMSCRKLSDIPLNGRLSYLQVFFVQRGWNTVVDISQPFTL